MEMLFVFNLNRSIKWREYLAGAIYERGDNALLRKRVGGFKKIEGKVKRDK